MQSLYTADGLRDISERLDKLRPDSKAIWGKMNPGQMLAHVRGAMEVPLGTHPLKPMFIMNIIGGMIRKKILSDAPLSKNSPTAPSLVILDERDFEKEKQQLLQTLQTFSERGMKGEMPPKHPYFGKMSVSDWDKFQQRHLEHHLSQFGV